MLQNIYNKIAYLDIESVTKDIFDIYVETRDNYVEDYPEVSCQYDDELLEEYAEQMAWSLNGDMKRYLHQKDHNIVGNLKDVYHDFSFNKENETRHFDEFVESLDKGEDNEQSIAERKWLTEWFWEMAGTLGIEYNFSEVLAEYCYGIDQERERISNGS